jgi:endonuclease G
MLCLLTLTFASCGDSNKGGDEPTGGAGAYWNTSSTDKATVRADQDVTYLVLPNAIGASWSATLSGGSWCSFTLSGVQAEKSGVISGARDVLYVYFNKNTGEDERTATLSITIGGDAPQTFNITQLSSTQQAQPSFSGWAEIPEEKDNSNYTYVTHTITLDNKKVRNYSICFDKSVKASLWVAYPLHSAYIGGLGRTDEWAFDPLIADTWQANCVHGSYKGAYDRGHQIPSGDRTASKEMNEQTFYMSNMTPQASNLNQQMWANLESKIRSYSCSDTLYVVTGAYFGKDGKGSGSTTDAAGNTCPLPSYYYKVVLRTRSGNTGKTIKECQDSELKSIGFWVQHKAASGQPTKSICKSVSDIEKETGFTFFPQVSAAVKSQNVPAEWGINN